MDGAPALLWLAETRGKTEADPFGMTTKKAKANATANTKANAGVLPHSTFAQGQNDKREATVTVLKTAYSVTLVQ
jgi:hypothetical protein